MLGRRGNIVIEWTQQRLARYIGRVRTVAETR